MNPEGNKGEVIRYWLEKSEEALAAARDDYVAGRLTFSVGRAYYACFYALSAVLLHEDYRFAKHSGVRIALHRYYVKTDRVAPEVGRFYDRLFDNRQRADYQELAVFEPEQVEELLAGAVDFVQNMHGLLPGSSADGQPQGPLSE